MELGNLKKSKNLHHHSLPIVIIAIGIIIGSTGLVVNHNSLSGSGKSLVTALFTRTLNVKQTSNVSAQVSLNKNNKHVSSEINQVGRSTELTITLETAKR